MTTVEEAAPRHAARDEALAALELAGVVKSFGSQRAVDAISWSVRRGDFVGLLGPNGAGKTTLISMISGLVKIDEGKCRVFGIDTAKDLGKVKRVLGVVPQDLAIYPELSARDNLRFFGAMYGLGGAELKDRTEDALRRVGLEDRAVRPAAGKFSGGQKRRLNIAAALLHRPEILILDEPTVGIDPQSRNFVFETLRELNREGMTIVYVTHYMEEVEALCRTVAIVDHGRLIEEGPLERVLERHGSSLVRLGLSAEERQLAVELLEQHPEVSHRVLEDGDLQIAAKALPDAVALVTRILTDIAPSPETCKILPPSLETVFIELTGNQLRDS
ncbi:ABC transporter ATP-binding protein [Sinomonas sp. ASV486]|uniref:ABC transporter ATP-binding protein n=1 Tax=Sinomonas puerhi TaxID=3238584 RepID=A0AB39L8W7_9MICC|nr:ABC transporter ATP-binding protein [Sinomonas sp. ASV486]MDQ4492202.1 ABC transporter ATP-binding protein [Sinomonas sp. ASV486]